MPLLTLGADSSLGLIAESPEEDLFPFFSEKGQPELFPFPSEKGQADLFIFHDTSYFGFRFQLPLTLFLVTVTKMNAK